MMAVVSSDEKKDFTQLRSELEEFGQSLHVKNQYPKRSDF